MVTHESIVRSAVTQYHGDPDFRRFVDSILARLMLEQDTRPTVEQLMGEMTPTGVPAAVLIYKRYCAAQVR